MRSPLKEKTREPDRSSHRRCQRRRHSGLPRRSYVRIPYRNPRMLRRLVSTRPRADAETRPRFPPAPERTKQPQPTPSVLTRHHIRRPKRNHREAASIDDTVPLDKARVWLLTELLREATHNWGNEPKSRKRAIDKAKTIITAVELADRRAVIC